MSWGKNYIVRPICWMSPFVLLILGVYCGILAENTPTQGIEYFLSLFCFLCIIGGIILAAFNFLGAFTRIPITIGKIEKHLFENYLVIVVEGKKFFKYERGIHSEYYDFQNLNKPEDFVLLRGKNTVFVELADDEKLGLRMHHNVNCLKGVQS